MIDLRVQDNTDSDDRRAVTGPISRTSDSNSAAPPAARPGRGGFWTTVVVLTGVVVGLAALALAALPESSGESILLEPGPETAAEDAVGEANGGFFGGASWEWYPDRDSYIYFDDFIVSPNRADVGL